MKPHELFILCATAVTVVFVLIILYYFRTRRSRDREQAINKWHRLIQAMIESESDTGDLESFSKLDLLAFEMVKHNFTHNDINVTDTQHLRRIASSAYSRGLAKLKVNDPKNRNIMMLKESLAQFRRAN